MRSSSRALAAVALAAAVATGAAACSSSSTSSSGSSSSSSATSSASGSSSAAATASLTIWADTTSGGTGPSDLALKALAQSFNSSHPGDNITVDFISDANIKTQLQTAMGAGNEPPVFWTWGGGVLDQYIKAGKVVPLGTTSSATYLSSFLPSTLGAVTFNGQVYGVPVEGTQPVYFFYNKKVFSDNHLTFPTTWSGLLSTISTLKAKGIAPISLAEGGQWPGLMYLEYLTDRVGGPTVAKALQDNAPNAWKNPAITEALTDIQTLAKAGAFNKGFDSTQFNGQSDALVTSGKAAMQLMGDWDLGSANQTFVNAGNMGMAAFPSVGSGDPADLAGNTATYLSISTAASPAQQAVAKEFFASALASSDYAKKQVAANEVPVTTGADSYFTGPLAAYQKQIYTSVQNAPSFTYSWDQMLVPSLGTPMLTNLQKIFDQTETPAQFEAAMTTAAASAS
jgi:ABC-type glycerol-3-phosphate transport system substrate-binding protein